MTRRNASKSIKIPASERPIPAWLTAVEAVEAPGFTKGVMGRGFFSRFGPVGSTGWFLITGGGHPYYLGYTALDFFDRSVRVAESNDNTERAAMWRKMAAEHGINL
jgi:hypothetical protein